MRDLTVILVIYICGYIFGVVIGVRNAEDVRETFNSPDILINDK